MRAWRDGVKLKKVQKSTRIFKTVQEFSKKYKELRNKQMKF